MRFHIVYEFETQLPLDQVENFAEELLDADITKHVMNDEKIKLLKVQKASKAANTTAGDK